MKRYEAVMGKYAGLPYVETNECSDGRFVLYSEAQAEIERLKIQLEQIDTVRSGLPCNHVWGTSDFCTDPDGAPCYPNYGLAPHTHAGNHLGETKFLPESDWPPEFEPDPDCHGFGTWHCPKCGA